MSEYSAGRGPVGVVGAGTMGVGVAQCFARAGYSVIVVETNPVALKSGPKRLRDGLRLDRLLKRLPDSTTPPGAAEALVHWTDSLDELSAVWFVVECARELVEVKEKLFRGLDHVCPQETIFASCTSAIPISRIGSWTGRPDRVLGMHFMNPAPLKDTVEVITASTSQHTLDTGLALLKEIGKDGVVVRDAPGFVSNRVLMLTVNEAATVVQDGTADAATVDQVFQGCFGHPMGPLKTADLIGLDTIVDSLVVLRDHTGDAKFEPCPLLVELVRAGRLGRKSGRGFHDYQVPGRADG